MSEPSSAEDVIATRCCIVGGGPAGMMLGLLLARAAVDVVVLEKHPDFFRDFRGDTIHPSTLELFCELGLLDAFLKLPHREAREISGWIGQEKLTVADFSHLPVRCKFIAFMPQWDFLNFLAERAKAFPNFRLLMSAEATDLLLEGEAVAGVRAIFSERPLEIRADLTIGADGRHSTVRDKARLDVIDLGAPMDVLWFKITRQPEDPEYPIGRFDAGRILVLIDRGDYWQCGFIIPKGGFGALRQEGLAAFRDDLARLAPFLAGRVAELRDWENIRLLTVVVDRLRAWSRPGLLCIGDAAHAMSPIGGVGINLAIQDAVAAANILSRTLRSAAPTESQLRAVQRRRELPTRIVQALQLFIQNRIVTGVLAGTPIKSMPAPLRLLRRFPVLRRLPARLIGLGFRPEHIQPVDAAEA